MSIPAQRFKVVDGETTLAVQDFVASPSTDVLNSPIGNSVTLTTALNALVNGNKTVNSKVVSSSSLSSSSAQRTTDGGTSNHTDTNSLSDAEKDAIVSQLFSSNEAAKTAYKQLSVTVKNQILSKINISDILNTSVNDGTNTSAAQSSSSDIKAFSNLIAKLTDNSYSATVTDNTALRNLIVAVIVAGYELGVTYLFTPLVAIASDKNTKIQIANQCLLKILPTGNMIIVLDIAKSDVVGYVKYLNEWITSIILHYYTKPVFSKASELYSFYMSFYAALLGFDPTWMASDFITSTETAATIDIDSSCIDRDNTDLVDFFKYVSMQQTFTLSTDVKDACFLYAASTFANDNVYSVLEDLFLVSLTQSETVMGYVPLQTYLGIV